MGGDQRVDIFNDIVNLRGQEIFRLYGAISGAQAFDQGRHALRFRKHNIKVQFALKGNPFFFAQ